MENEMKLKHTPGPWSTNVWTTGRYTVEAENGLVIAEVHPVHDQDGIKHNGRLIAASPDMKAVLKQTLAVLEQINFSPLPGVYDSIPFASIEKVISRTEGKEV